MEAHKKPRIDANTFRIVTRRRPIKWIVDAAIDWLVIAAAIVSAGLWNHPIGYFMAVLVIGNRQHALAILGHDGTHMAVSRNRKVNDLLTDLIAFWPIGLTTTGYRNLHFKHHQHTNTQNDPELMHRSAKAPQWDLPVTPEKVLKYAAMDMIGYSLSDYLIIVAFSKPEKKSAYVYQGIFHAAALTVAVSSGYWWVAALWYLSLPTAFMMYFRLRTWLEHQGSEDTHILHLNLLQRLILSPHYAWYHYEHHHWPSVPYYNLPALRSALNHRQVMTLSDLVNHYAQIRNIPSGHALKDLPSKAQLPEQTKLAA